MGNAYRVNAHLEAVGLLSKVGTLNLRFLAARLIDHMRRGKKTRDGALRFLLVRGIEAVFTSG